MAADGDDSRGPNNLGDSVFDGSARRHASVVLATLGWGLFFALAAHSFPFSERFVRFFEHVADGLIIAAILAWLLHFTDIASLFVDVVTRIMIDHRFLRGLSEKLLRELRAEISEELVEHYVDNKPIHEWRAFHAWTEKLIFEKCLPSTNEDSGIYRRQFFDEIILTFLTLDKVLEELELSKEGISAEDLALPCIRNDRTSAYEVVCPKRDRTDKYPIPLQYIMPDFAGIDPLKRVRVRAGNDELTASDCTLEVSRQEAGRVYLTGKVAITFDHGIATHWRRSIEYQIGNWDPFMLNTMSVLTKGVTVRFSIAGQPPRPVAFVGMVFGLGVAPSPSYMSNGFRMQFDGWLLEDHGYMVHWWEKQ